MKIIITGAAGFLGQKLAATILEENSILEFDQLLLIDINKFIAPINDPRIRCVYSDIGDLQVVEKIIDSKCHIIFHLAAVVSGQAEIDFDIGMKVNFDNTRQLLDVVRRKAPHSKFIFTSTCGVFGGKLPTLITDYTAITPENSYGMEKALCELLINDYSRRGFVDGRVVRLPTVSVRPGKPNKAVTSFISGMIREPLNGEKCLVPVSEDLPIWVCSPGIAIRNIIHASLIQAISLGCWRVVNLPGITVTVKEMKDALRVIGGDKMISLLEFKKDELVNNIILTFPRYFDTTRALQLGFSIDTSYEEIIQAYIREHK